MEKTFRTDKHLIARAFFFAAFAFLAYQAFLLARPFLSSLLFAGLLTVGFHPLHKKIKTRVHNDNGAAFLSTLCVILSAVLPLSFLSWMVIREGDRLIPAVQTLIERLQQADFNTIHHHLPDFLATRLDRWLRSLEEMNIDVKNMVLRNMGLVGAKIAMLGRFLAANVLFTIFRFLILIISLFFFFRDGERFLKWALQLIPMEVHHKQALARTAYETFWAVAVGTFLTATAQGTVATIGYLVAGIKMPFLLGFATTLFALLGASFMVTFPAGLLMLTESTGWGVFLILWGAIAVGWLDNFLRPLLIGSRTRMPFILIFFSILGGLNAYGLTGILLGPIVVACLLAFIRIFREAYNS